MAGLDEKMSSLTISGSGYPSLGGGYPSLGGGYSSLGGGGGSMTMPQVETILFVDEVPNDLICPLCLEVFTAPCLTSCGHHFCDGCIAPVVASEGPCPVCREEGFTVMRNRAEERRIDAMSVYCSFRKEGCSWVGRSASLDDHKRSCEFACEPCPFLKFGCSEQSCTNEHLRSNFANHMLLLAAARETQQQAMTKLINEKEQKLRSLMQRLQLLEAQSREKLKLKSDILWHPVPLTYIGGFVNGARPGQTFRCLLSSDLIPKDSKEILLHVAITAGHSLPDSDSHWLEVYVKDSNGMTKYSQMTRITTRKQNAYSDNSENMTFPMPTADQTVYLQLPHKSKPLQKRAVCKIYVIGYKR